MLDKITDDQPYLAQSAAVRRRHRRRSCDLPLPTLTRFLADFTLGFADGLTVPFALTAGLSLLGQTETVIYAGMAEICAGSISMGVGGYLSARGETAAAVSAQKEKENDEADEEKMACLHEESEDAVARHLAPLELPADLRGRVLAHVMSRPHIAGVLATKNTDDVDGAGRRCSPVIVGLSVSLGYLLGGLLPLFPYFFVDQVGDGLLWSFVVCLLALFIFGFCKDVATAAAETSRRSSQRGTRQWSNIRRSAWEGFQMVILGGAAAVAAVLCIRLFEGINEGHQ